MHKYLAPEHREFYNLAQKNLVNILGIYNNCQKINMGEIPLILKVAKNFDKDVIWLKLQMNVLQSLHSELKLDNSKHI